MFIFASLMTVLCSPPDEAAGGVAVAPAPTQQPGVALTRSDLDRHIEQTVSTHITRGISGLESAIDSLRAEVLGKPRSEELADTRDKARRDFDQAAPSERARLLHMARANIIEGRAVREERLPKELQEINFGRGFIAARYLGYYGNGVVHKHLSGREAHLAVARMARADGDLVLARIVEEHVERSVSAGDAASAGALIPEVVAADFITALYARSIVRQAGAVTIQLSSGNLTLGKQNATAISYWLGETDDITASEPSMTNIRLTLKKLGSLVPITNDALRFVPNIAGLVQSDMLNVHRLAEDIAFIRSEGNENKPKGIRHWLHSDNVFAADTSGSTLFEKIVIDTMKAQFKVENGNVPMNRPAWMTSVREKYGLMSVTVDGRFIFSPEIAQGTFMGAPFFATTQIPSNLNTDQSELYYQEMSQVIIGEGMTMEIAQSTEATINVGGTDVRLFQSDQTAFRLIGQCDLAVRHDRSGAVVTGTEYGAQFTS